MEELSKYNADGTVLRDAQLRMLEILRVVDTILTKHDIVYYLDGGTLLGAVRHGGFIPWDDDLDISVRREDYSKIRTILQQELPSDYVFQDRTTDKNYPLLIGKVRDLHSYFEDDISAKLHYKGIYIDIIPMEKIPSMWWKGKLDYLYGHCVRAIHNYTTTSDKVLSCIIFPIVWLLVKITRFVNIFVPSDHVADVYGWRPTGGYFKKDVFPVKRMKFEGIEVCVPNNPDAVLRALFGDYMQIPPKEKRAIHTKRIEFYD